MKPHDIIKNYCQLYGISIPRIDYSETQYFVTLSDTAKVLYMRCGTPKLIGRLVGEAMKRGTVLHVYNGYVKVLTWDNWGKLWDKLFAPHKPNHLPKPNTVRPYKSEIFEYMKQESTIKKPQKHGFERTYSANKSMELLAYPLHRVRIEPIR